MSFLPIGYEVPKSSSSYTKLEQGKTKIRILSDSIVGTLVWNGGKPHRFAQDQKVDVKPDKPTDKPRHFWAFVVWNYETNKVEILEVTQKGIQESIMSYFQEPDYGDPKKYDLTITRSGESLDTKYQVIAGIPKKLEPEIEKAYKDTPINLQALFTGEDPFTTEQVNQAKETFNA